MLLNNNLFDILVIREYFPSRLNPNSSSWVLNQVKFLANNTNLKPLVVSPSPYVPQFIINLFKYKHHWKERSGNFLDQYLGINVYRPKFIKLPSKYFFYFNLLSLQNVVNKYTKNSSFRLIHSHYGHAGVYSDKLSNRLNIPHIVSFYGCDLGSDKIKLKKKYLNLAKSADIFLALSNDMKEDLVNLGFPPDKIIVHHIGVDTNFFSPACSSTINQNKITFLVVANFEERKGIHYIIQAFNKICKSRKNIELELRIVGDGYYKEELILLAKGNYRIKFINNYQSDNPRQVILDEIRASDVFVLASCTMPNGEKEGTPVVLLEAQSCEKPCIATKHAGIPEQILDDITGKIVRERDVVDLYEKMNYFIQNPNKILEMGLKARKHILSEFSDPIQNKKLLDIYKQTIKLNE